MPHQKRSIGLMEWVHQSNNPRLRLSNDFRQKTRRTPQETRGKQVGGQVIPTYKSEDLCLSAEQIPASPWSQYLALHHQPAQIGI